MTAPRFTPEQRAAIDDRRGSRLLAANAGSGKTAVLVERFVEAVLADQVPVGAILAITFTEKAAAELRERTRRRFAELGAPEAARATDTAWIGTIHGFCARVLRAAPLAAGVDPRFRVLDEAEAQRLAARAYDAALDAWAAAAGPAALDLAAAYGDSLRDLVLGAHGTLRARGQRRPTVPVPPPAPPPDPQPLRAAHGAAAQHLAGAGTGKRVSDGLVALEACVRVLDDAGNAVPIPGALSAGALARGGKALGAEPTEAYRAAWVAFRQACADHHARPALALIDALLGGFADRYEAEKRERAALDFDDLELGVRDLLAGDPRARRHWAERFELIMVDEFQDTNRLQLDVLETLERDNLLAVGDELQSIYAFRHADVEIFRARRATLGEASVRRLRTNFRSTPELLDVLNVAFAPRFGEHFAPLEAGRETRPTPAPPARASAPPSPPVELRLFDPDDDNVLTAHPPVAPSLTDGIVERVRDTPVATRDDEPLKRLRATVERSRDEPRVELLLTDTRGWDEPDLTARLGLAGPGTTPARRAEARLVAQRLREDVDAGRSPGDIVVLVRATASLRLFEAALDEQGLATFVLGGRGYWSDEQVRDGLAYLAALANPRDERAFYAVLASPFCRVGSDALVLLAEAGRTSGAGAWAALQAAVTSSPEPSRGAAPGAPPEPARILREALPAAEWERLARFAAFFGGERARVEREPVEALLERAIVATGYDLAVLRRRGGERRLANLRKLMRLARDHERAEGRDLHAFVAYAQGQDVAQAREGDAALESDGLDAIRLMTIHRAKGLEFPVVCIADLGRTGNATRPALLVGDDGRVGLRLRTLGSGESVPALDHDALGAELAAAEAEEDQRLLYVAATRAQERLLISGTTDLGRTQSGVARAGGAPLDWLAPALLGSFDLPPLPGDAPPPAATDHELGGAVLTIDRPWESRTARLRVRLNAPITIGSVLTEAGLSPLAESPTRSGATAPAVTDASTGTDTAGGDGTLPARPVLPASTVAADPRALARLSHSALRDHARCGYRFYLERVLGLPPVEPPAAPPSPPPPVPTSPLRTLSAGRLDARARGTLVHLVLEKLDLRRPVVPVAHAVHALAAAHGLAAAEGDVEEVRGVVAAFAGSPLRARLAAATRVQREAPFGYALDPGTTGARMTGVMDVLARERDGTALVVDYKTARLAGREPAAVVDEEYETQRVIYALAALRDGAPRVEVAHVFLERPDAPVLAAYSADDAPALGERLRALADDLLAGRYPVASDPHPDLCADCPGRRALCSWPESRTLRAAGVDQTGDFRRAA